MLDEVNANIKAQIREGAIPVRPKPQEWNWGHNVGFLGLIAPSELIAARVLANLGQVMRPMLGGAEADKKAQINVHSIVRRTVEAQLPAKIGGGRSEGQDA